MYFSIVFEVFSKLFKIVMGSLQKPPNLNRKWGGGVCTISTKLVSV